MAPQVAPHRRGGTHRVKDEDRTNTIYDTWNYDQLKKEVIERKLYIKDMKKVAMAKKLAQNDREKKEAKKEAQFQAEREKLRLAREKKEENDRRLKADAAKHRRKMKRKAKRARFEDVSDTTPDEDEIQAMYEMYEDGSENQDPVGQALSEESWDSTSTESSLRSSNRVDIPACKLRLFEWPYQYPPSPIKRTFDTESVIPPRRHYAAGRIWYGNQEIDPAIGWRLHSATAKGECELPLLRNVPYAPLKVHTTHTSEKLFLPGQTYPPGVDPDYVPVLSDQTRHAARNGILEGVLRRAMIEPAANWADRTQIQGWNARMFFHLPPRNEEKELPDVYEKWYLESRKLLRVKPAGDGSALTRKQRHNQRRRNKGRKRVEVLESSWYRVPAMCYLPAYLDYSIDTRSMDETLEHQELDIDNLFYIRFPGCDVPHYCFWTRYGEWSDPTTPNPAWTPEKAERDIKQKARSRLSSKSFPKAAKPSCQILVRDKKPLPPPLLASGLPNFADLISRIEKDIYTHGLSSTLANYRARWIASGNTRAWPIFGKYLPGLYPSGELPSVPPVHNSGKMCVAEKLARVERGQMVYPMVGKEPWTRFDDEWWDIVGVNPDADEDGDADMPDYVPPSPSDLEPLYRRVSVQSPLVRRACEKWLEKVSHEDVPLTPGSMPYSPARVREEWEERFAEAQRWKRGFGVVCPFCLGELRGVGLEEQAKHIYAHSAKSDGVELPRVPLPARKVQGTEWMTTKRTDIIDTCAEADGERTPGMKPRLRTGTKRKRSDPSSPDNLAFLNNYSSCNPWSSMSAEVGDTITSKDALDRRSSKTIHPVKKRKVTDPTYRDTGAGSDGDASYVPTRVVKGKKRKRVADSTYRHTRAESEADEAYIPTRVLDGKKRKRIADPTFRVMVGDGGDSDDQDEDVKRKAPRRKKGRKAKKTTNAGRATLPSQLGVTLDTSRLYKPGDKIVFQGDAGVGGQSAVQESEEYDMSQVYKPGNKIVFQQDVSMEGRGVEEESEEGLIEQGANDDEKSQIQEEDMEEKTFWDTVKNWCVVF